MGCSCCNQDHGEHHHHHHIENEKSMRKRFIRLCIAIGLFLVIFVLDKVVELAEVNTGLPGWVLPFVCFFAVYLIQGLNILKNAVSGLANGYILDENFLMALASLGAFALGIYRGCIGLEPDGFEEGCAVIIFYCIGEFFQDWALGKSERAMTLMLETYGLEKHCHHASTKAESFITRFARVYTPIVAGLAAAIAIIPPVIGIITGSGTAVRTVSETTNIFSGQLDLSWTTWIYRALSFLVVSCPCALVISIPLSFSVGISTAGRNGILVKSAESIEIFAKDYPLNVSPVDNKSEMYAITADDGSDRDMALVKDADNGIHLVKKLSLLTMSVIKENICLAIGVKIIVLILSAFGISNMWVALISDEGIALIAVLNALRIGLFKAGKGSKRNG